MSKFLSNKVKPKKNISKYRKHTEVFSLVASIKNIFISAHYEEMLLYFIVRWDLFCIQTEM